MKTAFLIVALVVGAPVALLFLTGIYANSAAANRAAFRAIERYCLAHGCTDVEPFLNSRSSFGVRYTKDGERRRGKCSVTLFTHRVHFEKNDPAAQAERPARKSDGEPRPRSRRRAPRTA